MEIEINGKIFTFDDNPRFGIMEMFTKFSEDPKYVRLFIKEVLRPVPSAEEIFNFRKNDIISIIEKFQQAEQEEAIEIQKKHSR